MADLDTLALPLLPLTTGVVLPGMVVTLTLESPEARAAVDAAAGDVDRLLVLVPRLDGRYARVGTIAKIEDLGKIRGGTEALVIRGLFRATIGVGAVAHMLGIPDEAVLNRFAKRFGEGSQIFSLNERASTA